MSTDAAKQAGKFALDELQVDGNRFDRLNAAVDVRTEQKFPTAAVVTNWSVVPTATVNRPPDPAGTATRQRPTDSVDIATLKVATAGSTFRSTRCGSPGSLATCTSGMRTLTATRSAAR
jgi:hypothetical protein